MRVLLVSANREHLPEPVVPLGALYVLTALPARHDASFLDLCFEDRPLERLREQLRQDRPQVVGIGMRNLHDAAYAETTLDYYDALISAVREVTEAPIVLGGSGFSVMPPAIMHRLRPDYGIAGEAEEAFARLVDHLEAGERKPEDVPQLYFWREGQLAHNPPGPFLDLAQVTVPDRSAADPRYYEETGIEAIQTKRGCALTCDYCTYPVIEGRRVRRRAPEDVVEEMAARTASNPDISHFFFVDSVFNLPPTHAKALCRTLIERGPQVPWTCYANPIGLDAELVSLMKEAGCSGVEVGSDSGCDEILARLRKGFDTARIRQTRALCAEAGLPDCHTFILGTPGEGPDHVERTLDFVDDLDPHTAVFMVYKDDVEAVDPELAASRRAVREQALQQLVRRKHPRWVVPELSLRFDHRLFRALRRSGLRGPLWQQMGGG